VGGIQCTRGFIGIWGYKKGNLVKLGIPSKNRVFLLLLEICIGRGVQQKDLGGIYRYLVKLIVLFNIP
jgi:hypothetical protein